MLKENKKLMIHSNIYWRQLVSIRFTYHCQVYLTGGLRQTIRKINYQNEITIIVK